MSHKGIADGYAELEIGMQYQGLKPSNGDLPLPLLTLSEPAYHNNRDVFFRYIRQQGVAIAPHAKTPMSPEIAQDLVAAGAWGATVANIQQMAVMLRAGLTHVLLGNQLGGMRSAAHLAALRQDYPNVNMLCFADSIENVAALALAGEAVTSNPIGVLVEVGAGRCGARDLATAKQIAKAVEGCDGLYLAGVATYEGSVAGATEAELTRGINELFSLVGSVFQLVRQMAPTQHLIISAGGSVHFDRVVNQLMAEVASDSNASLLLRSGAIFFSDHGVYKRALANVDSRQGFQLDGKTCSASEQFQPAIRMWAEVISRPEANLAICGMGMRDVAFDQGLPVPLCVYRNGHYIHELTPDEAWQVSRLNDQHAFLSVPETAQLQVGDIIEFGISHPCTCFDRWRSFFGVDEAGVITKTYRTYFA